MKIELDENPSTGYRWFVDFQDEGVAVIDLGFVVDDPNPELVGGGGTRSFEFKGDGLACLTYKQPWEGGGEARDITISVRNL